MSVVRQYGNSTKDVLVPPPKRDIKLDLEFKREERVIQSIGNFKAEMEQRGPEEEKKVVDVYGILDEDGIASPGEKVHNRHILINKHSPSETVLRTTSDYGIPNVSYKPSELKYKKPGEAVIDQVGPQNFFFFFLFLFISTFPFF